jgi:unsaturated rhamnogalacturonyl hydrolase
MSLFKYVCMTLWMGLLVLCLTRPASGALPGKQEVIDTLIRVNDYWMNNNGFGGNGWARATYYEGDMAMYAVHPDRKYYNFALGWAQSHNWQLIGGDTTRLADNQCAGQTYLDLYRYAPAPEKIAHIKASVDSMVNSLKTDDWYWIDALQMAMPVFARLGAMYANTAYYDRMYALYHHTKYIEGANGLYSDNGIHNYGDYLWWRDAYNQTRTSPNGKMFYWSRGNGWVIAAHVRTLQHLPNTDPHYAEYVQTLQEMASALKDRQQPDGFWYVNLDDPHHNAADPNKDNGPETSGTGFFTYALAWGINHGLLDAAAYRPVVEKAWNGMVEVAVHPDGKLGFCQGGATSPEGGQPIGFEDTADFCVGAFLLAGSEVAQMKAVAPPGSSLWRTFYSSALGTFNAGAHKSIRK